MKISASINASPALLFLSEKRERLGENLFRAMQICCFNVERRVKDPYLTGKALHVRTGRLRSSIASRVKMEPNAITGEVGTNVWYGRFWELEGRGGKPRPFLLPAFRDEEQKIMEILRDSCLK